VVEPGNFCTFFSIKFKFSHFLKVLPCIIPRDFLAIICYHWVKVWRRL